MGTRADFYNGTGLKAKWIASIAWDGYPEGICERVIRAESEKDFHESLENFLQGRDDVSGPDHGWPWPWEDSRTTDYAYCWDGEKVQSYCFGHGPVPATIVLDWDDEDGHYDCPKADFPDMTDVKNVTLGERSGVIVISV